MKITVTISETREEEGKRQNNSEIVLIIKRSVTVSVLPTVNGSAGGELQQAQAQAVAGCRLQDLRTQDLRHHQDVPKNLLHTSTSTPIYTKPVPYHTIYHCNKLLHFATSFGSCV